MKHLSKVLFFVLAVVCFSSVNAQDKDNPWIVEIGTNVVDFYPTDANPALGDLDPANPIEPVPISSTLTTGTWVRSYQDCELVTM